MISIKDVTEQDIDFLWKMIQIRDKREFLDDGSEFPTYEQHIKFVKTFLNNPQNHHYKKYKVIFSSQNKIGVVLLMKRNNELGYYLLPQYQNKGYGTIALTQLMDETKLLYFTALIHNYNTGSQHFFEKLGAKPEGIWYKIKK